MQIYAVCFDISDDKARKRAGNLLLQYGHRQQYSVFEIAVKSVSTLEVLQSKLNDCLEEGDKLVFYRLCQDCRKKSTNERGEPVAHFPAAIVL